MTLTLNFMRPICVDNMMDRSASKTEDLQGKILKNVSALPNGRERGGNSSHCYNFSCATPSADIM